MRSLSGFRAGSTRSLIVPEICAEDHNLVRSANFGPGRTGCAHCALQGQRCIAVTSRQSSGPHGKLMPMRSTKHVGAEPLTGEEAKLLGVAHTKVSEKAAASYPIILRSYEPVTDLDERLRRIFAVLSLPPVVE
jgi:hypothetical protein